ncbi:hypothetical protein Ancab_004534 [Ancistrocladus abbreviatus]
MKAKEGTKVLRRWRATKELKAKVVKIAEWCGDSGVGDRGKDVCDEEDNGVVAMVVNGAGDVRDGGVDSDVVAETTRATIKGDGGKSNRVVVEVAKVMITRIEAKCDRDMQWWW